MIKSLGNVSDYGEERQEMKMCQYDRESKKAEEFINHEEILETLRYAEENKHNEALIAQILEKAKKRKGLEHREAMVLLDCDTSIIDSPEAMRLRQSNCYVRTAVFIKLLCEWMRILSISCKE